MVENMINSGAMRPGDVITTEKDAARDVLLQVEGRNKLLGQIGQYRGSRAIRITRVVHEPAEPEKAGEKK